MTTASAPIASRVSAVSLRLSPLETLEPLAEKLMTSADSRLAAASNEMRVRVQSSKKRLTTVRPRSVGSFLTGAVGDAGELLGGVEDEQRVVAAEVAGREQVLHALSRLRPRRRAGRRRGRRSPRPGRRTVSRSEVGRFLPT